MLDELTGRVYSGGMVGASSESDSAIPGGPERETDASLIQRVREGDVAAFDQIIERYKTRIYGVVYSMVGNHDDAAELSQDVFLRAFKSIGSFKGKSDFYTWLNRVCVNTTLNFIQTNKRKGTHLSLSDIGDGEDEELPLKELTSSETAVQDADRDEIQKRLNEALQKLSKEHRAVVVLHDIEGMKHHEIAKVLGCTEATARSRLFYAHQQLQALLANYL